MYPHASSKLQIQTNDRFLKLRNYSLSPSPQKHNVLEELCDIVRSDPMASTVKLQALRALNSLLDYPQGLERFLGWSKGPSSSASVAPLPPTPYQHMINLILSQPVRTLQSICPLSMLNPFVELS